MWRPSSCDDDREYVIGFEDKQPTPEQLDEMRELVRKEMEAAHSASELR